MTESIGQGAYYDEEGWLTPQQTADRLGIHERTLRRWRHEGRGPKCFRLGPRLHRYRQDDLDAWIHETIVKAGA